MADFTNPRDIRSLDQLSAAQLAQLQMCGIRYHGKELPPADLLPRDDDDSEDRLFDLQLWDVTVDGEVAYEAWRYQVDSGSIFDAGSGELVAEIIQFGLECDDPELELLLGNAMVRARLLPKSDGSYRRYAEAGPGSASTEQRQ